MNDPVNSRIGERQYTAPLSRTAFQCLSDRSFGNSAKRLATKGTKQTRAVSLFVLFVPSVANLFVESEATKRVQSVKTSGQGVEPRFHSSARRCCCFWQYSCN